MTTIYYVYLLIDPIRGEPIYVGKGSGWRMYLHAMSVRTGKIPHGNIELFKILRNIQNNGQKIIYRKVLETSDEQRAFDKEKELIAQYGRRDKGTGILTNLSNGGDGQSGYRHTEESKRKLSTANSGQNNAMYGMSGEKAPGWKRVVTEETRRKLGKALKGREFSKEHREKLRRVNTGKVVSEETRRRMSKGHIGLTHTEESKQKIRVAKKAFWGSARGEQIKVEMSLRFRGGGERPMRLSPLDIPVIRRLCEDTPLQQKQIAGMFGVSPATISDINCHRIWRHVA